MGIIFVACNECAFPVCRLCYDYERKDGTNLVLSARPDIKGIKRVSLGRRRRTRRRGGWGLGNEYHYVPLGSRNEKRKIAEAMLYWKISYGRGEGFGAPTSMRQETSQTHIALLINGHVVPGELPVLSFGHNSDDAPPSSGGGSNWLATSSEKKSNFFFIIVLSLQ